MTSHERVIGTEGEWAIAVARIPPGTTHAGNASTIRSARTYFSGLVGGLSANRLPGRTEGRQKSQCLRAGSFSGAE